MTWEKFNNSSTCNLKWVQWSVLKTHLPWVQHKAIRMSAQTALSSNQRKSERPSCAGCGRHVEEKELSYTCSVWRVPRTLPTNFIESSECFWEEKIVLFCTGLSLSKTNLVCLLRSSVPCWHLQADLPHPTVVSSGLTSLKRLLNSMTTTKIRPKSSNF